MPTSPGPEFNVSGTTYRARRLNVLEQFQLFRRVTPLLGVVWDVEVGLRTPGLSKPDVMSALFHLVSIPDSSIDDLFEISAESCEARDDWGSWSRLDPSSVEFADAVTLTSEAIYHNFTATFNLSRPKFYSGASQEFQRVEMPDGEDYVWRPVLEGLFRAESLWDGTVTLDQVVKANDALDVRQENERRAYEAAAKRKS